MTPEKSRLTPKLVLEIAALAGLPLDLERAKALLPTLETVFDGDQKIAALGLARLSGVGKPWEDA